MPPALLGVVALLVIGAIVFFYLRSKKAAEISAEQEKDALPAGKQKQDTIDTSKPKVEVETVKPKVQPAVESKAAPAKTSDVAGKSEPHKTESKAEPAAKAKLDSAPTSTPGAKTEDASQSAEKPSPSPAVIADAEVIESVAVVAESAEAPASPPKPPVARAATKAEPRDVTALKKGLKSARGSWVQRLVGIFSGKKTLRKMGSEGLNVLLK